MKTQLRSPINRFPRQKSVLGRGLRMAGLNNDIPAKQRELVDRRLAIHTLDEAVSHGISSATRTYVCREKAR
jgi:hypothetical protein